MIIKKLFLEQWTFNSKRISTANTLIGAEFLLLPHQQDATAVALPFSLMRNIFWKGTFLNVATQKLILDQYTNSPNYRVGLTIEETIINPDLDPTLTDNSAGFNNLVLLKLIFLLQQL